MVLTTLRLCRFTNNAFAQYIVYSYIVYLHPSMEILSVPATFLTLYSFLITPEGTFSKNPSNISLVSIW